MATDPSLTTVLAHALAKGAGSVRRSLQNNPTESPLILPGMGAPTKISSNPLATAKLKRGISTGPAFGPPSSWFADAFKNVPGWARGQIPAQADNPWGFLLSQHPPTFPLIPGAPPKAGTAAVPTGVGGFGGFPKTPDYAAITAPPVEPSYTAYADPAIATQIQLPKTADNSKLESLLFGQANQSPSLGSFLQAAGPLASQFVKPAIAGALLAGNQGMNTVTQFNRGAQQALQGIGSDIGGYYNNAIGIQGRISDAIGASLAAQNPNAADQAVLQNYGSPESAQAAVGAQNQSNYGLGGAVLSGIGNLGASGLEAQKAGALAYARELPALLSLQGGQALSAIGQSTQQALAKIYATEGPLALKIATAGMTAAERKASNAAGLFKTLTGEDLHMADLKAGLAKANLTQTGETSRFNAGQAGMTSRANAAETGRVSRANAANTLAAQRNRISAYRADITAFRAMNPGLYKSAASVAKDASDLDKWHNGSTSITKSTSVAPSGTTQSSSVTQSTAPKTWAQAYGLLQVKHPDWTPDQLTAVLGKVYSSYGDGGRPLDPPVQTALSSAGQSPDYQVGQGTSGGKKVKVFYLTEPQAQVLIGLPGGSPIAMQPVMASDGTKHYVIATG